MLPLLPVLRYTCRLGRSVARAAPQTVAKKKKEKTQSSAVLL
jgi:hypothetical protein